jgi:hypothetical protein
MSTDKAKRVMEWFFDEEASDIPMMGTFMNVPLDDFNKDDLIQIVIYLERERRKMEERLFSRKL